MAKRVFIPIAALLFVACASLRAIHMPIEARRVPIDRLIANLERAVAEDPNDVQTVINLARVHSMAYALKLDDFPASQLSKDKSDVPFFPPGTGAAPGTVRPAPSAEHAERAARHLKEATRHYESAVALAPDNITARLGYGWVLQQAGDTERAITEYRRVVQLAWAKEENVKALMPSQRFYTQEAIDYLLPLLDRKRDAAEIQDLMSKQTDMKSRPRAITPIAIPLTDDLAPQAIVNNLARVRFDADGSRLDREWTWITRDAGWLVYDADGRGEITSALQLFGNVTFWLFWENGYNALSALDDDDDGELAGRELNHIRIWHDRDADGVSDSSEVRPPSSYGIVALSCDFVTGDGSRFAAVSPKGARLSNGRTRPTYDVILRHSRSMLTRR
jgi:tetratricopeptide (TPR) repeat protein